MFRISDCNERVDVFDQLLFLCFVVLKTQQLMNLDLGSDMKDFTPLEEIQ